MKPPDNNLLELYKIGCIIGIHVDYVQTGTDTADTKVRLIGSLGKIIDGWASDYMPYLTLQLTHNTIASIRDNFRKELEEWFAFERRNKRELREYRRLKKKFEGGP